MFSSNLVENVSTAYRTSFSLHAVCGPSVNNENLLQHHWLLKGTFSKKDRKSFFILAVNVCE